MEIRLNKDMTVTDIFWNQFFGLMVQFKGRGSLAACDLKEYYLTDGVFRDAIDAKRNELGIKTPFIEQSEYVLDLYKNSH